MSQPPRRGSGTQTVNWPFLAGIPSAPGYVPKYESNDRFSCMMITTCRILWMPGSAELLEPDGPAELAVHDVASSPAIAAAAARLSAKLFPGMRALCSARPAAGKDNAERTQRITSAFHEPTSVAARADIYGARQNLVPTAGALPRSGDRNGSCPTPVYRS